MDPFQTEESSTPSPQNNGSGDSAQSVSSDDFVKVENSSGRLLDLEEHTQVEADAIIESVGGDSIKAAGDLMAGGANKEDQTISFGDNHNVDFLAGRPDDPDLKHSPVEGNDELMDVMDPGHLSEEKFDRPISEDVLKEWQKDSDDEEFLEDLSEGVKLDENSESPKVAPKNHPFHLMDFGKDDATSVPGKSDFVEEVKKERFDISEPEAKSKPELLDDGRKSLPVVVEAIKKEETKKSSSASPCLFSPGIWFDKEKLNPKVADLLYWKDVKKTGIAFGSILLVLLSLAYFSLISVIAYSSLTLLGMTLSFRIYKSVITAVQKSTDGHPFKECLDKEYSLSPDKVRQISDVVLDHGVSIIKKTKSLFLVEDIVDSLKFGLVLYGLTYIGAWFNGITILILAFVSAFTLPKVYETHKSQIDHYVGITMAQVKDVMDKVKAKVPMLNKKKEA